MPLILLNDLHLRDPGMSPEAAAHAERVGTCLDRALALRPDAGRCIINGDLADAGEVGAYRWLKARLDALPIPCSLTLGNHDARTAFQSVFGGSGFVQSTAPFGGLRLIFLDTLDPGSDGGALCGDRLAWLDHELGSAGPAGVCIFMHHPPCDIGDPVLDPIRLSNAEDFAAVLQCHNNVRHICFGHVHRTIFLTWNGIPCAGLGALVASASAMSQGRGPVCGILGPRGDGLSVLVGSLDDVPEALEDTAPPTPNS
ncbi:MAG: metallophosphoesterase [Paracoccaceae bacterium]|nr:metallophosphoesterase [Paracoccaceae bacterium]